MSNAQTELGRLIRGNVQRDAVHIAVAPVTAREQLFPGQRVGLVKGSSSDLASADSKPYIGIVDPFLDYPVPIGMQFWLFLFPNTITGLNHVWTHPAFQDAKSPPQFDKAASEVWLREFCANADCPSYDTVMAKAREIAEGGNGCDWDDEYMHFGNMDAHGDIPPEFWMHVAIIVGHDIKGPKAKHFSCSC